jgi:hypothetical protein
LFDLINKEYPELDSVKLKKEKVYEKMFPGKKFKDSTLRLLMFYLYECCEKFIIFSKVRVNKLLESDLLARGLIDRGLTKETEKVLKNYDNLIEAQLIKNERFFRYKYLHSSLSVHLNEITYPGRYEKYLTGDSIDRIVKNLTNYYLLSLLKYYTVVLHVNEMYKSEIDVHSLKELIGTFKPSQFRESPLIEMYYYASLMLEEPSEETNYFKLKEILMREEEKIDNDSLVDLYINLENYCVRRGREGKSKFDRELFEVYNMEIEKKVYVQGTIMTHQFYKSAVLTALVVNEISWAERFIEEYKNELAEQYRDAVYCYCCARLEHSRRNFDKSLSYLSKVKTDEIYLKTEAKLFFAVIYYELNIDDSLISLLDTMRHFFKNDRFMADERKYFFWDFVKILNKIIAAKNKGSNENLMDIKEMIDSKEKLFLKNWLREKVTGLEK